jgi:hypothetical protein
MLDDFLFFTPMLLVPLLALLGFVGCQLVFPLNSGSPVSHVQTTVKSAPAGTDNILADPLNLEGGELIIATVQWRSPAVQQPTPSLTGASFSPVVGGGPFDWNGMRIITFIAANPDNNQTLTVAANLAGGSNLTWHLCVSAYKDADPVNPVFSPQQNGPAFFGATPTAPPINIGERDLVYAVVLAADGDGTFPGGNSYTAGPGFTAEFPAMTNPLVEDGASDNPVVAQATNTAQGPAPRGFIFAMGVKAG